MKPNIEISAPDNFPEIVSQQDIYDYENGIITFTQKCTDEVLGTVEWDEHSFNYQRRSEYDNTFIGTTSHDDYFENRSQEIRGKILMILESPHSNEFDIESLRDYITGRIVTSRPANGLDGKTGQNIDKHLEEILNNHIELIREHISEIGVYSFSIMNAIPYPCSLGHHPVFYRDEVFLKMWEKEETRDNFQERINSFSPDLIINACTRGKGIDCEGKERFITKQRVSSLVPNIPMWEKAKGFELRNIVQYLIPENIPILQGAHPASYFSKKNRELKSV